MPKMPRLIALVCSASTPLLLVSNLATASTGSPQACAPTHEIDPMRLLRQASLDLRGRPPTFEEYTSLAEASDPRGEVESLIEGMFSDPSYYARIRQYHQLSLWGNVSPDFARLFSSARALGRAGPHSDVFFLSEAQERFRGRDGLTCLDEEQTDFDSEGRPIPIQTFSGGGCPEEGCRREGWVEVSPYWAPNSQMKVCAYDAQAFERGLTTGEPCSDVEVDDPSCGCGDSLRYCTDRQVAHTLFRQSLAEEGARIFEYVVREQLSYLEGFTGRTTVMNGPVARYYADHLVKSDVLSQFGDEYGFGADMEEIPDLDIEDTETWVPVVRGLAHAGAFTTAGYLYRFASNRSRANRYFSAFYCDPFIPSEDGLPPEEANPSPNLRERAGCADCHQVLEPAAAHFARWRVNGSFGYLSPDMFDLSFPREECACDGYECTDSCNEYYVTRDNSAPETYALFAGRPIAVAYATETDIYNAELGPKALADEPAEQQAIARCAVASMARFLLHRDLGESDIEWIDDQTERFVESEFNFTQMVASLVADPRYRAIQ